MEPFVMGNWIGEVKQGGSVNYRDIFFNPHGNCTHTECVGHISETIYSVNRHFKQFHCIAQLISLEPLRLDNGDAVIGPEQLVGLQQTDAVIIRTLPNTVEKRNRNYSGTNPPYLLKETIEKLVVNGCKHLILDLPSIDREEDGGQLLGHKAFWNYPENPRMDCTVTELAFVPDAAKDGLYLLNLQVAPFENDAAPSRPLIFPLKAV
ncbi:MAG: cyclase family protein [Flavobacteriales bacterium]|nr:cyclase family protein [Flavobacteriales bacterium]